MNWKKRKKLRRLEKHHNIEPGSYRDYVRLRCTISTTPSEFLKDWISYKRSVAEWRHAKSKLFEKLLSDRKLSKADIVKVLADKWSYSYFLKPYFLYSTPRMYFPMDDETHPTLVGLSIDPSAIKNLCATEFISMPDYVPYQRDILYSSADLTVVYDVDDGGTV